MHDPRLDKLAEVLVNYSAGVKAGDLVLINGMAVAEPAVAVIYRAVLAAGGHPWVRLQSELCKELQLKHGSEEQLRYTSPFEKFIMDRCHVYISFWGEENTRALSNVDPAKQALASQARKPILTAFMKRAALAKDHPRRVRWVGSQYPTQAAAQDAEMSLAEYADFVFGGGKLGERNPVAAWRKLGQAQQRLCDVLNKAREVRFRANGTDIRLGVAGRRWMNCDGHENFPDGEVFTGPIEDATEGTVHYTYPAVMGGREVTDVRLTFKAGRVVDAAAGKNEEFLHKMIEQDKGARVLGELALGTNYAIRKFTRNTLFDEKIGGTFHLALGAAYPETGGRNVSGLHWDMVCDLRRGGTIEVDGKVISRDGRFTNAAWPR
ncbi:MAG: aminopeptidase [Planctomycetota bacterium]